MKKTAFMIVYNGADYLDYAIRAVEDWVDELLIIEGAFEITMRAGYSARSTDGTLDILRAHEDGGHILVRQENLREHTHQYDLAYQWALERGADWTILLDYDEIWTREAQHAVDAVLATNPPVEEIRVQEYCLINDFWHWYPGTYSRIFKAIPGSKFVYDNEVHFGSFARGGHRSMTLGGEKIFHYSYVCDVDRWRMKQAYMWEKDQNPALKSEYGLEGDSYIIPKDLPIKEFAGTHPVLMQTHPFYNKTAHEILYSPETHHA